MRACGACRRRKIKCDAATTNTWPCAACVKQSLECVPPSSENDGQDDDDATPRQTNFPTYQPAMYNGTHFAMSQFAQGPAQPDSYDYGLGMPTPGVAAEVSSGWPMQMPPPSSAYPQGSLSEGFQPPDAGHMSTTPKRNNYTNDLSDIPRGNSTKSETPDSELTDALQDLRIDQVGVGEFLTVLFACRGPLLTTQTSAVHHTSEDLG